MPVAIDPGGGLFWNSPGQCNPNNDGSDNPNIQPCTNTATSWRIIETGAQGTGSYQYGSPGAVLPLADGGILLNGLPASFTPPSYNYTGYLRLVVSCSDGSTATLVRWETREGSPTQTFTQNDFDNPCCPSNNWPPTNNNNNDNDTLNILYASLGIAVVSPADGPALDIIFATLIALYWTGIVSKKILDTILEDLRNRGIDPAGRLPPVGDGPIGGEYPPDWPEPPFPTHPRPKPPTAGSGAKEALDQLKKNLKKNNGNKTSCNSNTDNLRPGIATAIASNGYSNVGFNVSDLYGPAALPSFTSNNQLITAYGGSPPDTFPTVLMAKDS